MYNIYIFEDSVDYVLRIKKYIESYNNEHQNFDISKIHHINDNFNDEVDNLVTSSSKSNIYLLDIELGNNTTGLQIAKKIRTIDFDGYIIFLTSHVELTSSTFNYNLKALNFIDKSNPNIASLLFSAFDQIQIESNVSTINVGTLNYPYKSAHYNIPYNDILFIETQGNRRNLMIHTKLKSFEFPDSLSSIEKLLPSYFYRCHKSYIINPKKVEVIQSAPPAYCVSFNDSLTCYISKKHINGLVGLL